MQGYRVKRKWGWDCHGLPLENIIEQELGIKNKKEIEERGIAVFNEAARAAVLRYADDWKRIIPRMGRWVDMENDYKTMDTTYTESIWWSFKNLFDRKLIYEGYKSMHLCPRCGTTLANFEVAQGYKDIEDVSVFVKLPLEGQANTSLLVWTTTPWTLPGNTGAAVHKDATYVKVEHEGAFLILAKDRLELISGTPTIVAEFLGKELVGKKYEPPFPYFKDKKDLKNKNKGWRIWHAPYVSMENGTGAVHLAPAFGDVDLELAQKEGLPIVHHVTQDGIITQDVTEFAGLLVKKKGAHQDTDKKIVEALEQKGRLFRHETITHSYPHCWRCDTPLLVYASSSWFVNIQKLKGKLLKENKKIGWVPSVIGEKRFQNLLETAPDWAISRARYWGAPLPVWRNSKTGAIKTVGSIEDLLSKVKKSGNSYTVMRHGQAKSNVENILDSGTLTDNHLTEEGKRQTREAAAKLARKKIDMVIASPLLRTQETARIVLEALRLPDSALMTDERLREVNFGEYSGKPREIWLTCFASYFERCERKVDAAETLHEVRARVAEFLFEVERRYTGKNILIVTHAEPGWLIEQVASRARRSDIAIKEKPYHDQPGYLTNAEFRSFAFVPYPHNAHFDLDLHRPYIDEMVWGTPQEGQWKRIPDVFDCWYESGSMPYASSHYPFENVKQFNPKRMLGLSPVGYPADFIAESVDQTRGWFYSTLVLGVALFGKSAYRHVITNGLVLAQDGKKMSKKLKNYTDVTLIADRYGADALRYYLLSSPLIRGEDLNFTDRGVEEIAKKIITRLDNVRSFLKMYDDGTAPSSASNDVLDRWILSRLNLVIAESTGGYEKYELDIATRPLSEFIDDLSTWYLRRSRDRFKNENAASANEARATLRYILTQIAKVMAPVMPFYAEYLYREVKQESDPESVHLNVWPAAGGVDEAVLSHMHSIRQSVSEALEVRSSANIKVRQPLSKLTISGRSIPDEVNYKRIIADEVNVKEVVFEAGEKPVVSLDLTITPELKEEGDVRDVIRAIQGARKDAGLSVADRPSAIVMGDASTARVIERNRETIANATQLRELVVKDGEELVVQISK